MVIGTVGNPISVGIGVQPTFRLQVAGIISTSSSYNVQSTKVVGQRITGWGTPTGTSDRSAFDTATATATDVAEALKALIEDLKTHGLIG
jgi:hypothetical protein